MIDMLWTLGKLLAIDKSLLGRVFRLLLYKNISAGTV